MKLTQRITAAALSLVMAAAAQGLSASKAMMTVRAVTHSVNSYTDGSTTGCSSSTNGAPGNATTISTHCRSTNTGGFNATDVVEAEGNRYTITCGLYRGGGALDLQLLWKRCFPLIDGDTFPAYIDGHTMHIQGHKGGNQGKLVWIKYRILDIRPVPKQ